MGTSGQLYIDFDAYLRQGEPSKKEKALLWSTAIGLQKVDGLETSAYLQQTAKRNIEGEITFDEAKQLIDNYYISKQVHDEHQEDTEEADRVSANIAKLLSSHTLSSVFLDTLKYIKISLMAYLSTPERFAITTLQRRNGFFGEIQSIICMLPTFVLPLSMIWRKNDYSTMVVFPPI